MLKPRLLNFPLVFCILFLASPNLRASKLQVLFVSGASMEEKLISDQAFDVLNSLAEQNSWNLDQVSLPAGTDHWHKKLFTTDVIVWGGKNCSRFLGQKEKEIIQRFVLGTRNTPGKGLIYLPFDENRSTEGAWIWMEELLRNHTNSALNHAAAAGEVVVNQPMMLYSLDVQNLVVQGESAIWTEELPHTIPGAGMKGGRITGFKIGSSVEEYGQPSKNEYSFPFFIKRLEEAIHWSSGFSFKAPEPVVMIDLRAELQGKGVNLGWETVYEKENDFFAVEYSHNGSFWEEIGQVLSVQNSPVKQAYSYWDILNPLHENHFYRIKQVDQSGRSMHSSIVLVRYLESWPQVMLSPNPVSDRLNVEVHLEKDGGTELEVKDGSGRLLFSRQYHDSPMYSSISINTRNYLPVSIN